MADEEKIKTTLRERQLELARELVAEEERSRDVSREILRLKKSIADSQGDINASIDLAKQIQSRDIAKEQERTANIVANLNDKIAIASLNSSLVSLDISTTQEKLQKLKAGREKKLTEEKLKQLETEQLGLEKTIIFSKELIKLHNEKFELHKQDIAAQELARQKAEAIAKQMVVINYLSDQIGDGAKKIGSAYEEIVKSTNRWKTAATLLLKEGVNVFVGYEKSAEEFRKSTGLTISQSKEQRALAEQINAEYQRFGVNIGDAYNAIKAIQDTFSGLRLETEQTTALAARLSANFGVASENTAQTLIKFQGLGGVTEDVAVNVTKTALSMSRAAGVPFAKVMEDVAKASDDVLLTIGATPQKLFSAAIGARRLGVELNTIAATARRILDFNTSINDELNASALLGRSVNFQRARQLAFEDDIAGANEEILRVVKSVGNFNDMNLFQREALAKASGMELGALTKMLAVERIRTSGTTEQKERLRLIDAQTKSLKLNNKEQADAILNEREMQSVMTNLNNTIKQITLSIARFITPLVEGLALIASWFNIVSDWVSKLEGLLGDFGGITGKVLRGTIGLIGLFTAALIITAVKIGTKAIAMNFLTKSLTKNTAALVANTAATTANAGASAGAMKLIAGTGAASAGLLKAIGIAVLAMVGAAVGIAALGASLIVLGKGFSSLKEGISGLDPSHILKLAGSIAVLVGSMIGMGTVGALAGVSSYLFTRRLSNLAKVINEMDTENLNKVSTSISTIVTSFANVSSTKAGIDLIKSISDIKIDDAIINKLSEIASLSDGLMNTAIAMERLSSAVSTLSNLNYEKINVNVIREVVAAGAKTTTTTETDSSAVVKAINDLRDDLLAGNIAVYLDSVKVNKVIAGNN